MIYNKALNSQEIDNLSTQIAESLSIPKPSHPATEPFPTASVVVASVAGAALVAVAALTYRKKRKR